MSRVLAGRLPANECLWSFIYVFLDDGMQLSALSWDQSWIGRLQGASADKLCGAGPDVCSVQTAVARMIVEGAVTPPRCMAAASFGSLKKPCAASIDEKR